MSPFHLRYPRDACMTSLLSLEQLYLRVKVDVLEEVHTQHASILFYAC